MVNLGSVTFFLVYHESFLLSSAKLLKLIDMGPPVYHGPPTTPRHETLMESYPT